ncbi:MULTISPECIES: aspartate aminotransferase family protein [unclassified Clostridium]|uniref:aspartate aminotransferase family protein n=1 Tax=unclassified Clostridium TaxID=2614128 RepID=UPI00033DB8AC|nr:MULTISPECIES: aspartate aminotransferase family protein [unclassified Clostridium]MEE0568272.1 aspartate aminotransferase family protein [Clostridium sp.]CDB75930.1 acetylornithine aminotransferase [Clostridium sp. CAG:265]
MNLFEKANECLMHTYAPLPIIITHGEGSCLFDENNKKYIDFTSGIGVSSVGYNNKKLNEAILNQLNSFAHLSNIFLSTPTVELANKLTTISKMSKVFFSNSGAEANEGALKLAKKYSYMKYGGKRNKILSLKDSFHGRTLATLTATGQDKFHKYFDPFPDGYDYVTPNSIEDFKEKLTDDVCAIIMEAIQGEGGVNLLNSNFVQEVCNVCKEKDVLIIFDEVQCGLGRTGHIFCFQEFGVEADIITLAKGLGGGLPIGAILCNEKLSNTFTPGDHGSTFGGNPVVCAGALAVLDQICNDELLSSVQAKGKFIRQTLTKSKLPLVKNIRGLGLMIGIEVSCPPDEIQKKALEKGILILTAGKNVVRLLPPLTISEIEIKKGLAILLKCLS